VKDVSRIEKEVAMDVLRQIADGFSRWMDGVASTAVTMLGWFVAPRVVRLAEQANGTFAIQAPTGKSSPPFAPLKIANGVASCSSEAVAALKGSQVELAMRSDQFFFRPLELPRRAAEFLDGIVLAQIDRITPWTKSEAVVGWSKPAEIASDKISVTVAAAPRAQIIPLTQAIGELGVKSVFVSTTLPHADAGSAAIRVFEHAAAGALEVRQVRRLLLAGLLVSALLAGLAVASEVVIDNDLQSQQNDVSRRIAERRGIIRAGNDAVTNSALAKLARRKNQTPANVIVLEALSNVLPDHTYVTELRIEGDKVQVIGITNDAPSLIRLIEQSPHFSRATFFAPTTRSPSDPGDRYHIEARIKPVFSPPS
jgi:general secretion pathway protein L